MHIITTFPKTLIFNILALFIFSNNVFSQNNISSDYFKQPQKMVVYADSCAKFWSRVQDKTYGGFYVEVGRQGNVTNSNKKSLVSQSRDAYGFSRAFMLTGKEEYLTMASSAIDFMRNHLYDKQYGGWFARTDRVGNNPYTGNKSAFDQHYALLGLMANYEATGDTAVLGLFKKGYEFDEKYLWDNNSLYFGYYNAINRDGSNANGKSFNATVDAITTHLINMYLLTNEEKYATRLTQMAENMLQYLEGNMATQVIGFPEEFTSTWAIKTNEKRTIMGHILKTGWCLARIYKIDPQPKYLEAAKRLVDHVLAKGYDHVNGGPYKDYDRTTGVMMMYGASTKAKAWWQMEQAITSGLLLFEITSDGKYLKMADESLDFFMKYFVDPIYNEVYADRSETGGRVFTSGGNYWDENKGSEFKAAYHSIETAYYAFMYGKLVVNNEPFTLYYKYAPLDSNRVFRMNPLEVSLDKFKLSEVKLNGQPYTNFDADTRLLTLPAQTGGTFAVTYSSTKNYITSTTKAMNTPLGLEFDLYPNPAKESAQLDIYLPKTSSVSIEMYNVNGKLCKQANYINLAAGKQILNWDLSNSTDGIYWIKIQSNNELITRKLMVSN